MQIFITNRKENIKINIINCKLVNVSSMYYEKNNADSQY